MTGPPSTDPVAAIREQAAREGWEFPSDPKFPLIGAAKESLRHALLGCKPVVNAVWDPASERVIYIGRICPVCERTFPHDWIPGD